MRRLNPTQRTAGEHKQEITEIKTKMEQTYKVKQEIKETNPNPKHEELHYSLKRQTKQKSGHKRITRR